MNRRLRTTEKWPNFEYVGTVDDNPQDVANAQRHYVDEAVTNLLAGRPVTSPITKPIGCAIKWKN